jgi:hypothetical protein
MHRPCYSAPRPAHPPCSPDGSRARTEIIRRAFAKQVMAAGGVSDPRVEAAFAAVAQEDFLGPGPWPMPLRISRGSTNSLFKFSVSGASPGASATTPAISPSTLIAIHTSPAASVFWDDLKGGHQRHKLRDRSPIPPSSGNRDPTARLPPRPGRAGCKMSGASAVSRTTARRVQPTLVFRQIVAPVQPGDALGAALVEGRGERLFAEIPGRAAQSGRLPRAARSAVPSG